MYAYIRLNSPHRVRQDVMYLSFRCELLMQTCVLYPARPTKKVPKITKSWFAKAEWAATCSPSMEQDKEIQREHTVALVLHGTVERGPGVACLVHMTCATWNKHRGRCQLAHDLSEMTLVLKLIPGWWFGTAARPKLSSVVRLYFPIGLSVSPLAEPWPGTSPWILQWLIMVRR